MSNYEIRRTFYIEFPKPIPKLATADIPDETGFTGAEKIALRNAMRVIMRRNRLHAFQIFIDYFSENEEIIEHFRMYNSKYNIVALSKHARQVLQIYDSIINHGLECKTNLHVVLTNVFSVHKDCSIPAPSVQFLSKAVNQHLLNVLKDNSSPTLSAALDKLSDSIQQYFEESKAQRNRII